MAAVITPGAADRAPTPRVPPPVAPRRLDTDQALAPITGVLNEGAKELRDEAKLHAEVARCAAAADPVETLKLLERRHEVTRNAVTTERARGLLAIAFVAACAAVGARQGPAAPAAPAAPALPHTERSLKAFDMANKDMNSYLDEDEFNDFEAAYDPREKAKHSTIHNCLHAHSSSHRFPIMRVNVAEFAKCLYQS